MWLPEEQDDRRDQDTEDDPGDQSVDHTEDDAEHEPTQEIHVSPREQRLLAEAIADLWLVPYVEPEFARLARAEHKRLKEQDAD